jgi:hypothetical protein
MMMMMMMIITSSFVRVSASLQPIVVVVYMKSHCPTMRKSRQRELQINK